MSTAFHDIRAAAETLRGKEAVAARLPQPKSADELRQVPDDRYFSLMSLRIFSAGLKHALVQAKWPAFEEAFAGFDPARVAFFNDEDLDRLMADRRLIRHGGKMRATLHNAAVFVRLAEEHGGLGPYLAAWPGETVNALWDDLAKRFGVSSQLITSSLKMIGIGLVVAATGLVGLKAAFNLAAPAGRLEQTIAAIGAVTRATTEEVRLLEADGLTGGLSLVGGSAEIQLFPTGGSRATYLQRQEAERRLDDWSGLLDDNERALVLLNE